MKTLIGYVLILGATILGSSQAKAWGESFRQTCNVRWETSDRVQADCQDTRGYYHFNDFSKVGCVGDIANNNGYLQCARQGGGGYNPYPGNPGPGYPGGGYGIPSGSYQLTCYSCSTSGNSLSCQCQDTRGNYRYTSLWNYQACRGDIANNDGNLQCAR